MLPAAGPSPAPDRRPARVRRAQIRRTGVLAVALFTALNVTGSPAGAAPARPDPGDLSQRLVSQRSIPQTSDGVAGRVAPQAFGTKPPVITNTVTEQYPIVPGLSFARFDRLDSVRGNVRGQLLTLDQGAPGLSLDYAGASKVPKTEVVPSLVARAGAIAGVNGDFFDIGDTGASLGVGAGRTAGLVKGPTSGWNAGFWVDAAGAAHVGELPVTTTIKRHARWAVAGLNPPSVPAGGIAAYDKDWRAIKGYAVTDEKRKRVRLVEIRGGRVVANRTSIPAKLKIRGKVLIGRGKGAEKLAKLRVGFRSGVKSALAGSPPMAITGNKVLLAGGIRQVVDDVEMHPRTAIGIDRDTNRILILVVDGRQDFSRGLTMVELAQLMRDLGADDALNLDGGGSSTMVAADAAGVIGVRNSPSDGHLREVANGLVLNYVATPGAVPTAPSPIFPVPIVAAPVTPAPVPVAPAS